MKVKEIADIINEDCRDFKYFYAIGLIKETLELWQARTNFIMLNGIAKKFATHYLKG